MNRGLSAWIIEGSQEQSRFAAQEWRRLEDKRQRLLRELKGTLAELRRLQGFLTVCCNCRRIQNEQGAWESWEVFIETHSQAHCTHGLCLDCARQLYPDLNLEAEVLPHETKRPNAGN